MPARTWEGTCLCDTQQHPERVEMRGCAHAAKGGGGQAPCKDDRGQPLVGADVAHHEVAGDLRGE